jgi:broad specificity phosphatase PhoE
LRVSLSALAVPIIRKKRGLSPFLLASLVALAVPGQAAADQVVFVVRHAERADSGAGAPPAGMMANDPPLSTAGNERSARLAALLASADVKHIYTTEYQRTRQTAAPLAQRLKVEAVTSAARDPEALMQQIAKGNGNVLIVGHSNTVPDLLKRLGVKEAISIADNEYDNLFVVVRPAGGEPTLIRLRY